MFNYYKFNIYNLLYIFDRKVIFKIIFITINVQINNLQKKYSLNLKYPLH